MDAQRPQISSLQIKVRTLLGTALLVVLLAAILIGLGRHALLSNNENNYQSLRNKLLETRKQELKSEVAIATGLISGLYEETRTANGDMLAAQKRALELLRPIRFFENKSGYFMVHALDGTRAKAVLVPVKTELEGTDITNLKDQNNKLFVQDFIKAARSGGGFVEYSFPNAVGGEPLSKLTYIAHFAPWDWEIGAGVYIDDLEAQALQIKAQRITEANRDFTAMLAMALFALLLIMTAIWLMLGVTVNRIAEQLSETIDGLQKTKSELQESTAFRKRVFESSRIPIVIMDVETCSFIDCNPAAAACYRFESVADTIGKRPIDVSAALQYDGRPSAEKAEDYIQQALKSGISVFEWRHQRPDGEIWDAEVHLMSFVSNSKKLLQFTLLDITERKKTATLMVQTEKMMMVGGLAAGMAHEINNPLGIIAQSAQNIQRRLDPELSANQAAAEQIHLDFEKLQQYLDTRQISGFINSIREATYRASKIITTMLAFSRKSESHIEYAELGQLFDQVLELAANDYDLKKNYDFKRFAITKELSPDIPKIPISVLEIEQVLLNLLKNAAQAMYEAGTRNPQITLRTRCEQDFAVIEIEDNGPGMPPEIRKRIFEPFYTTKETGKGTGLGLSVSYSIITNNHNGRLEVDSHPDSGTCFTIWLPLQRKTAFKSTQDLT